MMKLKTFGFIGLLFLSCNNPTTTDKEINENKATAESSDNSFNGVWTDGSGPNASFSIDSDSIYDVEHFTASKFYKQGDSVKVYYTDDTLTAKMYKIHDDTLVYEYYGIKTKYWRFND